MKFSEKLKQAMQQLGVNQAQVVGMTGKSKGSISMYLNDKTVPSEQVQSDIAVSLGLAPDYFEQDENPVIFKPSKCEDGIQTLTVHEVAKLMHKHTNTNLIAFNNGIYDIVTGELKPFSTDIVITNKIPWNYDPDAYNELADSTLNKLACGDATIRALLEECIGYCFYRRNELGKAFILTGDKSNGKSTFLDCVKAILDDRNISALDLKELGDRFNTSMMFGKLANIGDDIGDDFLQGSQVSVFKKIVTGNRIKAERKGQDPFEFNPFIKLLFSANDIPRMKDKTGAVLRRLVIIPFNATFSKDDPDYEPFIKYKLTQEEPIEYFIRLGVEGLKRVIINNGFTKSDKVQNQLDEYEEENNPILAFINDTGVDRIENEPTADVYKRYQVFCADNSMQPMSNIVFSKQINKRLGFRVIQKKVNNRNCKIFVAE
jgi:putative DNA primase/helicase